MTPTHPAPTQALRSFSERRSGGDVRCVGGEREIDYRRSSFARLSRCSKFIQQRHSSLSGEKDIRVGEEYRRGGREEGKIDRDAH